MQQNFDHALALTLREEGGFVNDPRDRGGPTNLGVTQRVWETYIGHAVDEAAMRALTIKDVIPLYRTRYWQKIAGDALPSGLDCALFDFAVNSGPRRASLVLQSLLNVKKDGVIGPITLANLGVKMKPLTEQPSLRENLSPSLRGDLSPSLRGDLSPSLRGDLSPSLRGDLSPSLRGDPQGRRGNLENDSEKEWIATSRDALLAMTTIKNTSADAGKACGSDVPKINLLIAKLSIARLEFLRSLPAFKIYGKGWTARVNRIADEAARII